MKRSALTGNLTSQNSFVTFRDKNWTKTNVIFKPVAYVFIILFLYTGASKLIDYTIFKEQIALSPLAFLASELALGLPIIEFTISILLFFPTTRTKGLYATLALMMLFTGYIIHILTSGENIPCSCGGIIEYLNWPQHLILNSFLIAIVITAILFNKNRADHR